MEDVTELQTVRTHLDHAMEALNRLEELSMSNPWESVESVDTDEVRS